MGELPALDVLAYLTVLGMAAFDVFLPILPADGTIITAGALAASGDLSLPLVITAGIVGAWTGDVACYHVGRRFLRFRPTGNHRRPPGSAWLRQVYELRARINRSWPDLFRGHPSVLLVLCRLIPGGRAAGALTAGHVAFSRGRFMLIQLAVATVWAGYETLLGFFSGRVLPAGVTVGAVLPVAELVLFVVTFTIGLRLWRSLIARQVAAAPLAAVGPEPARGPEPAAGPEPNTGTEPVDTIAPVSASAQVAA